jgi:hypothetical protein
MEYSRKIVEKAKQKSLRNKHKSTPKATPSSKTAEAEKTVSEHSQDDQTKPATTVQMGNHEALLEGSQKADELLNLESEPNI